MVKIFRVLAVVEGIVFPILLIAAAVNTVVGLRVLITVLGALHGALFCGYLVLVLVVRRRLGWNKTTTVLALVAALLPGGTWWVEHNWI